MVFTFFIYNSTEFVSNDNEDEPTLYTQTPTTVETQTPTGETQYPTTVETQTPKVKKKVKENTDKNSPPSRRASLPKIPQKNNRI